MHDPYAIFVGASDASIQGAGATGPPHFSGSEGTRHETVATGGGPLPAEPAGLTDWLVSEASAPYRGRWVLLDEAFNVLDSDTSPSALLLRHAELAAPIVVFVQPPNQALAV
ncbi:MAG: hypothetical protein WAQ33_03805 [Gaiellaceae bacterium]